MQLKRITYTIWLWLNHVCLALERGFSLGKRMEFCLDLSCSFLSYIQCSSEIEVPFWPIHCAHRPKPVKTGTGNVLFGSFAGTDEKYHSHIRRLGLCVVGKHKKRPSEHHLCFQCESFTVLYDILLNSTREAKYSDIRASWNHQKW